MRDPSWWARERVLGLLRSARTVAIPAVPFIGALAAAGHDYRWPTAVGLNGLIGGDRWDDQWQFWFLETIVWCYVGLAGLLAIGLIGRAQRPAPFGAALVALTFALGVLAWTGIEAGPTERYTLGVVAWCLALGACAAYAESRWQRLLVALLAVAATTGFFGDGRREAIVVGGVLLLLVGRPLHLPARAASVLGVLASASLWIYLTHWQVYPPLEDAGHPVWAILAPLMGGVAASVLWSATARVVRARAT